MPKYQNYPVDIYKDLKEMFNASAAKYGDKTLFMEKVNGTYQNLSFRAYADNVNALGTELLARGFGGKRIMVTGENCIAWVTAYMAVICGVGTVVPVDKEIPAEEIANIAKISEAAAVIYSKKTSEKIAGIDADVTRICFDELPVLIAAGKE